MKVLFLVRHGQSSWDDAALSDRERPLTEKGKRDAVKMGKRLAAADVEVDMILSSPARRARSTARAIAKRLGFERKRIVLDERLYAGAAAELLAAVLEVADDCRRVMLVGHNPELSELVQRLSGKDTNLPTCAVAELRFEVKAWAKIGRDRLEKLAIRYV